VIDARPMGAAYLADALWRRIGIAEVAARRGLTPALASGQPSNGGEPAVGPSLSKLAGCTWITPRVFIEGLEEVSDDACYRAMDFGCLASPSYKSRSSSRSPTC
jgi:hypothetical protein